MRPYILPGWRWFCELKAISNQPEWGWGFRTVRSGIDPEAAVFVPRLLKLCMNGNIYDPGMGPYLLRLTLAL